MPRSFTRRSATHPSRNSAKPRIRGAILVATALILAVITAPVASAGTNPDQVDGPGIITIEELNMCMWGSDKTETCFPNPYLDDPDHTKDSDWWNAEFAMARLKNQAVIDQFTRHAPDVITVSEGCADDMVHVAQTIGYQLIVQRTGSESKLRSCSVDRGLTVNAIMAKSVTLTQRGWLREGGFRTYVCGKVVTDEWSAVHVCTTHLSLATQDPEWHALECAYVRDQILDPSTAPTVMAGDMNRSGANTHCAPDQFDGLKNLERTAEDQAANPRDGLLHIYYRASMMHRQTCGWSYTVEHTDHEGFLLELGKNPPDSLGECWRGIRS